MKTIITTAAGMILALATFGCDSTVTSSDAEVSRASDEGKDARETRDLKRSELEDKAKLAIERIEKSDPSMEKVLRNAKGYAVFPNVGKGAVGVGGAHGTGVVYENGHVQGYCELTQATIGLQLGGQAYTEIIVFSTIEALNHFKAGSLAFDAQATAVAANAGAGANAKYRDGVAVFTTGEEGLMFEAAIGGQKFKYRTK